MLLRNPLYGFWAALLLFFGLLAPAAAQRGGDSGAFQVLSARYGTAERNVDVTERLKQLAAMDQPIRVHNDTFGADPDRGRVKVLRICARGPNGATRTFEYREDSIVDGTQFTGWSSGNWGQGGHNGGWHGNQGGGQGSDGRDDGEFRILQALYGTSEHHVDVTRRLRDLARDDRAIALTNDTFGVDPHRGRSKTLRIYVRTRGGQERMFEYPEGSTIDGARFTGWGGGNWGNEGWNGGWQGGGNQGGYQGGNQGGYGNNQPRNQLVILNAVYGAGGQMVNLTERLRSMAQGDRLSTRVGNELAGYDPAPNVPKVLWVTYTMGGREQRVSVREGEYLSLP